MWATRTDLLSSPALRREGGGDSKRPRQVKWVRQGLPASDKSPGGVMAAMSYNPSCRGELSTWRQVGSGGRHPLDVPRKLGRRIAQPRKATTIPGKPWDRIAWSVSVIGDGAEQRKTAHWRVGGPLHVLTSERPRPETWSRRNCGALACSRTACS